MNKVLAYLLAACLVIGGGYFAYDSYQDIKKENVTLSDTNKRLNQTIIDNNRTYQDNLKVINDEVLKAQNATKEAMENYASTEKKYNALQKEHNEKVDYYTNLINDGFRLRDPYARAGDSGQDRNSGQRDNQENHSTIAVSSDGQTGEGRLSKGLTQYLVNRSIEADSVVNQLKIVQEFSKKQQSWIIEQCNAVEATTH